MESKITLDTKEWDDFISHIDEKLKTPTKLLRSVFNIHGFADIENHFRNEEGLTGNWKPRSPVTNAIYDRLRAKGKSMYSSSNKLLSLSNTLRQSLLPANANIADKGRYAISVFTNVQYAAKHDEGLGNMPKREFMWLSDSAVERMAESILSMVMAEGQ